MPSAVEILKAEKNTLAKKFGVEELGIFGSVARGEDTPGSDIDILAKINIKTYHNYCELISYLEEKLKRKVDLVSKHKGLKERFLSIINKDIIYV